MSDWLAKKIKLGKTELPVGRLGLGAAYGAPAKSFEAAFDAGCNYFYWGALRNNKMTQAIRNIVKKGKREELVLVIQDFRRSPKGLEKSLMRGLKKAGLDTADVLLLGWHNKPPKPKVLDAAERLREQGIFRYLGLSSHKRTLFPVLAKDPRYDVFQIRYNAANRGAEEDLFPHLPEVRPGNVIFQATRRMSLVKSKKIPADEKRPTAGDCYRFALSNPYVDVVITGPSNAQQLAENMAEVAKGPMTEDELEWMRRIGDYVYGRRSV
ncbi:MAG: aldo/keto reductase [Candidatus Aminicenantes bacterium]|jgi:aryl-alcohol dehydrogenase-like predicted oxidoreductase